MTRKSDRLGIVRETDPYSDGYWARFDRLPKPDGPPEAVNGWEDCNLELGFEAACKRGPKAEAAFLEKRGTRP